VRLLTGTSGFAYPAWRGRFYPEDLADDAMLGHYAARLPAVEINNTFYRMPRREVLASWRARAGAGFTFVLKASRRISHQAKLAPPEAIDSLHYLWRVAGALGEQLGPVLIQTPPWLRKDAGRLRAFLAAAFPGEPPADGEVRRLACELVHPSWDDDETDQLLADAGCARCIADRDDGTARAVRTAPWLYVRLRRDDYAPAELTAWLDRLAGLGGDAAYVFFKHEETARGAELALELAALAAPRGWAGAKVAP
jgi:uncharacterized protein YecE (DUF72 family)